MHWKKIENPEEENKNGWRKGRDLFKKTKENKDNFKKFL